MNQVVLWDRIITSKADAAFSEPALAHKYALVDRGHGLRGAALKLSLNWSVMPRVGALFLRSKVFDVGTLPDEYVM